MGATLVKASFAVLAKTDVPAPARLVLLRMALSARDTDTTPLFWAGREELAQAAGYPPDEADTPSARRHVRRLVDTLVGAGLIVRLGSAHPGHNQTYALRLGDVSDPPIAAPVQPAADSLGDLPDPPIGGPVEPPDLTNGGSERSALGDLPDPPEEPMEEEVTTRTHLSGLAGEARAADAGDAAESASILTLDASDDADDELMHAQEVLDRLTPDGWEAAMLWAKNALPTGADLRSRKIAAARHLEPVSA